MVAPLKTALLLSMVAALAYACFRKCSGNLLAPSIAKDFGVELSPGGRGNEITPQRKDARDITAKDEKVEWIENELKMMEVGRASFIGEIKGESDSTFRFRLLPASKEQQVEALELLSRVEDIYTINEFDGSVESWSKHLSDQYLFPNHLGEFVVEITRNHQDGRVSYSIAGTSDHSGEHDPDAWIILRSGVPQDVSGPWRFGHLLELPRDH